MKKITICLILILTIYSCRPIKKVQSIEKAIEKKDTVTTIVVAEIPKVDSLKIIQDLVNNVANNKIIFNTFNAKVKVDYYGPEESQNFTAYISIVKDSIIYAQLKGALGIVGLQAKITKDSVIVVRKFGEKYIQKRSINYLQDLTKIPFDFLTLQNIIVGNPIFLSNNIASYKFANEEILVMMLGDVFKNLMTIQKDTKLVLHTKLDDKDPIKNRTCDITYSNFVPSGQSQFSTYRSISVSEKAKLDVNMDYKDFSFNEPLKYAFTLPKNFKIR